MDASPAQAVTDADSPSGAHDPATGGAPSASASPEVTPHGPKARNGGARRGGNRRIHPDTDEYRERDAARKRAERARRRDELVDVAQEELLRRQADQEAAEAEVAKLRASRPPAPPAPSDAPPTTPAASAEPVATPAPVASSAPQGDWPSEEQIAEAAPLAHLAVTVAGALCAALGAPILSTTYEVPVRGPGGVRKVVTVDAYSALTEAIAPVIAKRGGAMRDTPEAYLGQVAAAILIPALGPVAIRIAQARFPGLDEMLAGLATPPGEQTVNAAAAPAPAAPPPPEQHQAEPLAQLRVVSGGEGLL